MKYIQKGCRYFVEKIKWVDRTGYNRRKRWRLKNRNFTIIASNYKKVSLEEDIWMILIM